MRNSKGKGAVAIAGKNKPDWNLIKAEYIKGQISIQGLADKYGISYHTIRRRSEAEEWGKARKETSRKIAEKTAEKTADAAANNAIKLEKAREMAIAWVMKSFEQMPKNGGTHVRQQQVDKATGRQMTVDYDLMALVTALEKLSQGQTADFERQKKFASENNTTLMSYAELFKRPARKRTIEEIEASEDSGGEADVQN